MDIKKIIIYCLSAAAIAGAGYFAWLQIEDRLFFSQYTNEKEGLSIKYPKGWKVVPYPDTGAIVVMVKPKENPLVLLQANWNISATPVEATLTLDEYVKAANAQVQFMFHDAKAKARSLRLSGHEGREMVYFSPDEEGVVLITYVFIYKGVAYNLMYMDTKDAYFNPKKRKAIEHVIGSLKVDF